MSLLRKLNQWKKKLIQVCLKIFVQLSLPADFAKILINTKNRNENAEMIKKIENRTSDVKDRIGKMTDKERKIKMQMRH